MKHEKIANNSGAQLTADSGYKGLTKLQANSISGNALVEHLNKTRETKCGFQVRKILFSTSK